MSNEAEILPYFQLLNRVGTFCSDSQIATDETDDADDR